MLKVRFTDIYGINVKVKVFSLKLCKIRNKYCDVISKKNLVELQLHFI